MSEPGAMGGEGGGDTLFPTTDSSPRANTHAWCNDVGRNLLLPLDGLAVEAKHTVRAVEARQRRQVGGCERKTKKVGGERGRDDKRVSAASVRVSVRTRGTVRPWCAFIGTTRSTAARRNRRRGPSGRARASPSGLHHSGPGFLVAVCVCCDSLWKACPYACRNMFAMPLGSAILYSVGSGCVPKGRGGCCARDKERRKMCRSRFLFRSLSHNTRYPRTLNPP